MKKFYQLQTKSLETEGVASVKELWEKVKGEYAGLSTEAHTVFTKSEDEKKNRYKVTFSTADKDRHGDIVQQNFVLTHFKKNPVLLDSHRYDSIEHIVGKVVSPKVKDASLQGSVEFAEMNPKGQLAEAMAAAGYINATSVGFIPLEFNEEGQITKSELLEISLVSVPANAYALFEKTVKEVEEIKESVTEETPQEDVIESAIKVDKKKFILNSIAKTLQEMNRENIQEKRRQTLQAIRQLTK